MRSPFRRVLAAMVLLLGPASLVAQDVVVRVQVVDTANAAVAGTEIFIVEGLHDVLARGTTNDKGRVDLRVKRSGDEREIIARKIGLDRTGQFFRPSRDTVQVSFVMRRTPPQLETVKVSAREDVKRKSYHTDADEIAAATRPIIDGLDVLTKLKPDILYGRMPGCGVEYVWINGKLIRDVSPNAMVEARRGVIAPPPPASRSRNSTRSRPPVVPKIQTAAADPMTIVAGISAEHILEMNYLDCFATSEKLHGTSALYIVLKDGIGWDGYRSFVADNKKMPFKAVDTPPPVQPAQYRNRLVGVYDEVTGEPVAGVEVVDVATGTFARTTTTGTATLAFLPDGQSKIELRRAGYKTLTLDVSISPRDTMPLTLLLGKPQ